MKNNYPYWCEIDLSNLDHNIEQIKRIVGKTMILAVVKSNAYGHGIKEVGERLSKNNKINYFGVNSVDEAIVLRQIGIKKPILVMGYVEKEDLNKVLNYDLEIELWGSDFAQKLSSFSNKPFKVHIKIDTGVGRLGFSMEDFEESLDKIDSLDNIKIKGIMSHLAAVEEGYMDYTRGQLEKFRKACKFFEKRGFKGIKHIGATSAIFAYPEAYFDMVRLGIGLYGLWPSEETKKMSISKVNLKPLMSFKTKIVYIRDVKRGSNIGYGCSYKAREDMKVAILPLGYYEGLDRRHSNISHVLVNGLRVKIVGRVCMNMTMIDITEIGEKVKVGDEVVIFGKSDGDEITAEEFTGQIETIAHEMTTKIPYFVKRIYKG